MTVITVRSPMGRLNLGRRKALALLLTDAVLEVEIGQIDPRARVGFQVHFLELELSSMAIGGQLLTDASDDILLIDIAVMDGHWPKRDRAQVIANVYSALKDVLVCTEPSPAWWVNFRVIDEGSWGSRGGVLSILDLLSTGVFTREKETAIRNAIKPNSE